MTTPQELTPSDSAFWESRYETGALGWDKGECAPPIERMLNEGVLPAKARVVVLGAGRGHEAFSLAEKGYQTCALDFAPSAIAYMREEAARRKLSLALLQEDVFSLGKTHPAQFDAALEHTCFCAIEINRREDYVRSVAAALRPQGVLFGLFFAHPREGGPPFKTTEEEVRQRFAPYFHLERLKRAVDSFEGRKGEELEFVFRRKS